MPRAEIVAKTYAKEGAAAAAKKLAELTHDVPPETAKQILERSLPTVEKIAADLNQGHLSFRQHEQAFQHVAAAAEDAQRAKGGDRVVARAAAAFAKDFPAASWHPTLGMPPYMAAISSSVANGNATLPLTLAAQLGDAQRQRVTGAIANGVKRLQANVARALHQHKNTQLSRFIYAHAKMPPDKFERAMAAYKRDHPEALDEDKRASTAVNVAGLAAMRTIQALSRGPLPQLDPRLGNALRSLKEDKNARAAMDKSPAVAVEVAYQALSGRYEIKQEGATKGGFRDVIRTLAAANNLGILGDVAAFSTKSFQTTGEFTDLFGRNSTVDPKKALLANALFSALGITIYQEQFSNATRAFQGDPSVYNAVKTIYAGLGFAKELFGWARCCRAKHLGAEEPIAIATGTGAGAVNAGSGHGARQEWARRRVRFQLAGEKSPVCATRLWLERYRRWPGLGQFHWRHPQWRLLGRRVLRDVGFRQWISRVRIDCFTNRRCG